jgi:hypothetical protein
MREGLRWEIFEQHIAGREEAEGREEGRMAQQVP